MITLCRIDEKHIFLESKEVDPFGTWSKEWRESVLPPLVKGKFYKLLSKDTWEELSEYPPDLSKPNDYSVWNEDLKGWEEDSVLKEEQRVASITAKADEIIYAAYPQTKQNKMSSMSLEYLDMKQDSIAISAEFEQQIQDNRDSMVWIKAIRLAENTAITNETLLSDIDWTV